MKKILFLVVILIAAMFQSMAIAKDKEEPRIVLPRNADGLVQYQETMEFAGVSAPLLFSRAKSFGANEFVSAKDTLQNEDAAAGRLVYKGIFDAKDMMGIVRSIRFTMTIEVKEGKARITLNNFFVLYGQVNEIRKDLESHLKDDGTPKAGTNKLLTSVDNGAKTIIEDCRKALTKEEEKW